MLNKISLEKLFIFLFAIIMNRIFLRTVIKINMKHFIIMSQNKSAIKNNVNTGFISIAFLLATFFTSCENHKNENRYDLNIVTDIDEYNTLVKKDSLKQMVDLKKLIPGVVTDIRYATTNNFTGKQIYNSPEAFVRKPVAFALAKIQKELNETGLGLKIFDAYRPYSATVKFYEIYRDKNFVAAPWKGSVHNRGCAVDITLIDLKTNRELEMPTPFDDFTEKAAHSYIELPENVLKNRQTLKDIMIKHGFQIYDAEWWHYDFMGWKNFELMDISFEELKY